MRTSTRIGLAGLGCAMLTLSVMPPATASRPHLGNVQRALTELAGNAEVVGAIGAVYVHGRQVDLGSAGTRLLNGGGGRIPPGARFRIGSQTKSMTQVVIMKLVTERKLSLDDRLSDLLPEVAQQGLVRFADQITVEQLIHHTSGIPNWYTPELVDYFDFDTYHAPIELIAKTKDLERPFPPGEGYSYSNTNYFLLGLIIERLSEHHSVAAEFQERIFDRLHLRDTYLPVTFPGGIRGPHGHGYFPDENGTLRDVDRLNMSYGYAAGGVISTTDDLSAFHEALATDLLTKEEQDALNAGRPAPGQPSEPRPDPRVCGEYAPVKGGSPGFSALTYQNRDGSLQFIVSVTLGTRNTDPAVEPLVKKAAEAVLCPEG
ncbi:serine hydrolase domain-containing protein [Nonomuraea gerenzanensis]|uniref:D-alanyl-D-alanine carboxypeptidase n=1 Tax=Nonomuraea gerenzanensis TaxID=93944 RepID=A0A1M4EC06_9ACTN|nr:serine hydrolase domain-containing protein [Nonomuraea gerenzanensis]UBU18319.1 beta-lactamase family protein [Nonomuraea gerenzanensis]SBO96143.1 D-alanyl-D-alanine carboxypeptidase [Nonomuraea gerenzanensis]